MQRTKPDKEIVAVDIDIKINSIETSIREIKQLLLGFQTSSYRHVNPETLKGTLQSILGSLQSPLNQISSFLEEVNGPNSKLNASIPAGFSLPTVIKKKDESEKQGDATRIENKAEIARKEAEKIKKDTEEKARREAEAKTKREAEELARKKAEDELAKRKASKEEEERIAKEAEIGRKRKEEEAERKRKEEEAERARKAEEEAAERKYQEEAEEKVRKEAERKHQEEAEEKARKEAEEVEAKRQKEAEEAETKRQKAEEEAERTQREALADLAKTEEINVDGLSSDFDVSNLNFSTPSEDAGDNIDFSNLNAAAANLDTSSEFGSSAADLLASLEGGDDDQMPQFDSVGGSLSVDGLDFGTSNEADDLTNALSSLGSEQKTDLMDLLQSLETPTDAESKSEPTEASEERISVSDNFNFAPPTKKNKSANARVIKRGGRNALKNFNFEDENFEENFDIPITSLKRKGKKEESSVAVDDLLSNLDNLSVPTSEGDLANALSELSSVSTAKDDLLKSLGDLGDLQFDESTNLSLPTTFDDPIAASLKELEPAAPDWMNMFFTGKEDSQQPIDKSQKRRSSRIERLTPLPQREVGQLFRGYGVRDDINKAGLRRVKKGKGIHASGKPVLQMEDVNVILHPFSSDSNKALFAVFDGHVGKNCALAAKELWPQEFISQLSLTPSNDPSEAFKATYAIVDKKLSEYEYEGTTATTVYLWQEGEDRYLQAANVGDSTAFLCREGDAIWLTRDHKVSDPDEQNRLKQLGPQAWHPGKSRINGLAVSRAMGDFFVKNEGLGLIGEPYVSEVFKIVPGDSILIVASDGLWDVISGQAAMNLIVHLDDAEEMAKTLIRHALNSPKCNDNITIIVVTL